jgi:SAM-dependent methyltransferase
MQPDLYAEMVALEVKHFWFRARREVLEACLARFLPENVPRVILDAGCGTGANFGMLGRFGNAIGVDVFHDACVYATRKHPGLIAQGKLESLPVAKASIDLAVLLDVLEHVDNQQAVLAEMQRILRLDGLLVVSVPAFQHLWSNHDVVHCHRRRYKANELRRELEKAGFHIDYLGYFNTHLYGLVALTRFLKKHRVNEPRSDMRPPPKWLNALLYNVFRVEKFWVGRFAMPIGVSLLAVVRKIDVGAPCLDINENK